MKLPLTLSLYIGRQFFASILYTLLVIFALIGLIQLIELSTSSLAQYLAGLLLRLCSR